MTWPGLHLEAVEDIGSGATLRVGVSEVRPGQTGDQAGQSVQRVMLLLPSGERLTPPTRLRVRGLVMRVLGTQVPPIPGEGSLVTCELVNPDLPDAVHIYRPTTAFDRASNRNATVETPIWTGEAHLKSGDPRMGVVGGEPAPPSAVTVSLPRDMAADLDGAWLRVVDTSQPGLVGVPLKIAGDVTDSTSSLRVIVCHVRGVL